MCWREVTGRGSVAEFTVMYSPRVRGFEDAVPYVCVLVELDEQPELMLVGNLLGDRPVESVRIGLRVRTRFVDTGQDYVLPQFEAEVTA